MFDVEKELNEKLKEICTQLDIDPDDYVVVDKVSLEILQENSDELELLHEYGVVNWEVYSEATKSLKKNYADWMKESLQFEWRTVDG